MQQQRIMPFLTFSGQAEEAMQFYASSLPNAKITRLVRYGKEHPHVGENEENRVLQGELTFMNQKIMFLDMVSAHSAPNFTWAMSIFINCQSEAEFDAVFHGLSQGGKVMMGPEPVGNIRKCAWLTDKFGVTWQPVWE